MPSKNKCNKDKCKDSDSESSNDSKYIKKRKHTPIKIHHNNKCDDISDTCESEKKQSDKCEKTEEEEIFIKFEIKTTLKKGVNIIKIKFEKVPSRS
jgi:hypothetical protein